MKSRNNGKTSSKTSNISNVSIFDYNEPDDEEFDLRSSRRNFKKRKTREPVQNNKSQLLTQNASKRCNLRKKTRQKTGSRQLTMQGDTFNTTFKGPPTSDSESQGDDLYKFSKNLKEGSTWGRSKKPVDCDTRIDVSKNYTRFTKTSGIDPSVEESIRREEKCKRSNLEKSKTSNSNEQVEDLAASNECQDVQEKYQDKCPICNVAFTAEQSNHEINIHVNACLDSPESKLEKSEIKSTHISRNVDFDDECKVHLSDANLAKELQEREEAKVMEEKLSGELFFCGICQKDLNKLSVESRQLHVNRCADLYEKENASMRKAQWMSLKDSGKEFECLICGETFHTMKVGSIYFLLAVLQSQRPF